ncbi:MAG TPA: glycoside hydrolase [Bryobacteraceae bacterium]|jgi:photosystem II stability/assembly factor-like uncharacterized protein
MKRLLLVVLAGASLFAQSVNPKAYAGLKWRMIGPYRGGRTVAVAGIPEQPNVFYIGVNNGGVWKSKDFGVTWKPVFDDEPTGSIGALAVAPSNPNIVYVGSGEGLQRPDLSTGDGVYKSVDAGKTWTDLTPTGELHNAQQIGQVVVDPRDPNRVFVAALGHPYGPNRERGVYLTTDGGASWTKVFYKDENTGAIDLWLDPKDPDIVYTDLWAGRQAPWEIGGSYNGPGSGLYKSTDGGKTWHELTRGLPTIEQGRGRIGIGIAPSDPNRIFAWVDADPRFGGIYRSDDAGESWSKVDDEERIWGRPSDFACIRVHPTDRDTVFVANTSTYRSTNGGKNWTAIKGAPGGDDYHTIWINPLHPDIIIIAADQGATVTVNGGETWTTWYNQPTAQFYHVITDNEFPYWVFGGQQESGSAGVASRGNDGEITMREWHPVGVEEYGYVAPDPLDPNIIYGGKATRYNRKTGDTQDVSPSGSRRSRRGGEYRFVRTAPLLFSPLDPHVLYLGSQYLLKTTNGGMSWEAISPDLSREKYEIPKNFGIFAKYEPALGSRRGVIYTVAPSYKDANTIWCGTDDGLIQVTRDGGKTWTNVTPPALTPWSKVSVMDAGRFDAATAYAAINRFRLDDTHPYIYRTHDGGKTWTAIVNGIPANEVVNSVKEDPVRKGLLFAASELAVYFSIDDGDHWQSLKMNMPATSNRDITIHGDDLVTGTHGRGFWILDDITPLRQAALTQQSGPVLFQPETAVRVRRSTATDTPLPPEEPAGKNPPDGAILDYRLDSNASLVTLEILDASGKVVRRYRSDDKPPPIDLSLNVPLYWMRPYQPLPVSAGMHRFVWDLYGQPVKSMRYDYPISAVYHDTPREPRGAFVAPGRYTVRLIVDSTPALTKTFQLKMDPRVTTPAAGINEAYRWSLRIVDLMNATFDARERVGAVRAGLSNLPQDLTASGAALDNLLKPLEPALAQANGMLGGLLNVIGGSDSTPTTQAIRAATDAEAQANAQLAKWKAIEAKELAALNAKLKAEGRPVL